jgi:hypothetical protein
MTERGSNEHSPRLDEEMAREVASLTHGAPVEARIEDERMFEDAAEGEPMPESILSEDDEIRARSELARHLRPSIFPADVEALVQCAREEYADEALIASLTALPPGIYATSNEVWVALGGTVEEREDPSIAAPERDAEATTPGMLPAPAFHRFGFRFDWRYRVAAMPFGVTPGRTFVEVDERSDVPVLRAQFGLWHLETPLTNVADYEPSGPYALPKTIGPAHISLRDRGLTFASNSSAGLCISFREPVPAAEPFGVLRHPALTVTVDDVEGLAAALTDAMDQSLPR